MGRTYSLNGYLNAVLQRSTPTLLVEGITDKATMHRLVAERPQNVRRLYSIDHSGLFEDETLRGLGAREKVQRVQAEALRLSPQFGKLTKSLAYLLDREWDGLAVDPTELVEGWGPPAQLNSSFITLGHSIENYHFDVDCFTDYLKFGFFENFSAELERKVRQSFQGAIALAGALSCAARDDRCISRLSGLLSPRYIELRGDERFYLLPSLAEQIQSRCNFDALVFISNVNQAVDSHWTALSANPNSRWVLHGHLGSEALWACIGMTAIHSGVTPDIGEQIAKGFQQERRRCWLTWLSKAEANVRYPLDLAVDWLLESTAEAGA